MTKFLPLSIAMFFGTMAFAAEPVQWVTITQKAKRAKSACEALLISDALAESNKGILKHKLDDTGRQVWSDRISEVAMSGYGEYLQMVKATRDLQVALAKETNKSLKKKIEKQLNITEARAKTLLSENLHRWLPEQVVQYAKHVFFDSNGVIRGFQIGSIEDFVAFDLAGGGSVFAKHGYDMLGLSGLSLTNEHVKGMADWQGIERLVVADNLLSASGLKSVLGIKTLTHLNVDGNEIGGAGARAIARHTGLRVVSVVRCHVNDDALVELAQSKNIEKLRLGNQGDYADPYDDYAPPYAVFFSRLGLRALAQNKVLRVLDLSGSVIDRDDFLAPFSKNETLTHLGIRSGYFELPSVFLRQILPKKLTHLQLTWDPTYFQEQVELFVERGITYLSPNVLKRVERANLAAPGRFKPFEIDEEFETFEAESP